MLELILYGKRYVRDAHSRVLRKFAVKFETYHLLYLDEQLSVRRLYCALQKRQTAASTSAHSEREREREKERRAPNKTSYVYERLISDFHKAYRYM